MCYATGQVPCMDECEDRCALDEDKERRRCECNHLQCSSVARASVDAANLFEDFDKG